MLREVQVPFGGIHVYESRHQKGDVIGLHHHRVHQILFTLEGKGEVTLEDTTYTLEPNSVVMISPYAKHSIHSNHSVFTLLVLAFDASTFTSNTFDHLIQTAFRQSTCIELNPFMAGQVTHALRRMLFEQTTLDEWSETAMYTCLLEILLEFARVVKPKEIADSNQLRAQRIRTYIETHYYERLTAEIIGDRIGLSSRYVNSLFKEQYGITPTEYLTQVRIEIACKMLTETEKAIVFISFEVGFESLSTFYRNFKQQIKMSPHHYRRQYS